MEENRDTGSLTPIEVALGIDDDGFTTARKLYGWLELDQSNYSKWWKTNITENEFAEEGRDFLPFVPKYERNNNPKPPRDFKLSVDFAKKLCMRSHSERGEEARNYFIGCEQALKRLAEQKRQTELERAKGIAVRQALTKAIQQSNENERMHGHAYSTYTDVVYKSVFGRNAKQLREDAGVAPRDSLRDMFSQEELMKLQNAEMLVGSLIGYGWGYAEIKDFILNHADKMLDAK